MDAGDIRVAVMRIEGTNCEDETARAFLQSGARAEIVHLKQFTGACVRREERRRLFDYQCLMLPGGFSAGDYVRAGTIWSARIKGALINELKEFVENGYAVGGICNGFQVLVELGLLPAIDGEISDTPSAALCLNDSGLFECRHVYLLREAKTKCIWTKKIKSDALVEMPVAHGEGKFTLPAERTKEDLIKMQEQGQIVFRYCDKGGDTTAGYPWNPNGSISNIAGICNPEGNVFGLMPHPERVFDLWNNSVWQKHRTGDGKLVFESVIEYLRRRF